MAVLPLFVTLPETVPDVSLFTVRVVVVIAEASISSLNVAVMVVLTGILVSLSTGVADVTAGGAVSRVTVMVAVFVFPAVSVAMAVMVFCPSVNCISDV